MHHQLIITLIAVCLISADSSDTSSFSLQAPPDEGLFRRSSNSDSSSSRSTTGRDSSASWTTYGESDASVQSGGNAVSAASAASPASMFESGMRFDGFYHAEPVNTRLTIGGHIYIRQENLGEGQFGQVFAATRKDTGVKYAIKEMSTAADSASVSTRRSRQSFDFSTGSTTLTPNRRSEPRDDNSLDSSFASARGALFSFSPFNSPARRNSFRGTEADSSATATSQNPKEAIRNEINIMQALRNEPNIVRYIDSETMNDGMVYLVMEYCSEGDLENFISNHGALQDDAFVAIFNGLKRALISLRQHKIIHRDIKPQNILIHHDTSGYSVKLADFGLAVTQQDWNTDREAGSTDYMAPERLAKAKYDTTSDIWSAGLTAYQILTEKEPRDLFRPDGAQTYTSMSMYKDYITRYFTEHDGLQYPTTGTPDIESIKRYHISKMVSIQPTIRREWLDSLIQ